MPNIFFVYSCTQVFSTYCVRVGGGSYKNSSDRNLRIPIQWCVRVGRGWR